jgi:hypothetical protein
MGEHARATLGNTNATIEFRSNASRLWPIFDQGFAGDTRVRLLTRCGAAEASAKAVAPPYELPTRSQQSIFIESRNERSRSAAAVKQQFRSLLHSEKPAPGMSGANTSQCRDKSGITLRQLNEYPSSPCTRTSAGPFPACWYSTLKPAQSAETELAAVENSPITPSDLLLMIWLLIFASGKELSPTIWSVCFVRTRLHTLNPYPIEVYRIT